MRALLLALACAACGPASGSGGGTETDDEPSVPSAAAEPASGGSTERSLDPSPEPVVVVRPEPGGAPGRAVAFVVESRGEGPARLRPEVLVERRDGERWVGVEGKTLLRPGCQSAPTGCVELVPGAELRAAPWRGRGGEGQCECSGECAALPAGAYRFVVQSCAPDGHRPHRVASAEFTLSR